MRALLLVLAASPLLGCAARAQPVSFHGTVTRAVASSPVKEGTACTLHVEPAGGKMGVNCRVDLVCGGASLFGGKRVGGYADCDVSAHRFTAALDDGPSWKDGDPTLRLDVGAHRAEVTDANPAWGVEVTLEEDVAAR